MENQWLGPVRGMSLTEQNVGRLLPSLSPESVSALVKTVTKTACHSQCHGTEGRGPMAQVSGKTEIGFTISCTLEIKWMLRSHIYDKHKAQCIC